MGEIKTFSLSKDERLCDLRLIASLYESSDSIKAFPLIFSYKTVELPANSGFKVLFTVPKRNFKRAVHRNRIKRLMREAFRLSKPDFIASLKNNSLICSFIYTGKELPAFQDIQKSIGKIIFKLNEKPIS